MAWTTKEWLDTGEDRKGKPKRKRKRAAPGLRGVKDSDEFVVEWVEPNGKRRREKIKGAGRTAKRLADERCQQINSLLTLGQYDDKTRHPWTEFRERYEQKVLRRMDKGSRRCTNDALNHFQRIINPKQMSAIDSEIIDEYIAKRRLERGKKRGSTVSNATINKELRHLRAVFNVACRWRFLPAAPEFAFLRELEKPVRYVTPEHFAQIYAACDVATLPDSQVYTPAEWWRALIVFNYMTGWRIGEPLSLSREQLNLDGGEAVLKAEDAKGRRGETVPLHELVVQHLRQITSFEPKVFAWPHAETTLYTQFRRIQEAAGIHLPCSENHEHTDACHTYGFHDLRRAFATMNADRLTSDALQALMRHKSYQTTQRYINIARQLNKSVESLHVPDLPKATGTT